MSTTYDVMPYLDAIRDHLVRHELAAPVSVVADTAGGPIRVQVHEVGLAELAGALLGWSATLDGASAEVWRPRESTSVHVSVMGRMRGGMPVHVYGGVRYDPTAIPDLPSATHQDMPLFVLRGWASGKGVAA